MTEKELREHWKYEVANGDTQLGFDEWLKHEEEWKEALGELNDCIDKSI